MRCWLGSHLWGWPQAEGKRLPDGRFVRTGPDKQFCADCGATRKSPIQFGNVLTPEAEKAVEQLVASAGVE